MSGVSSMLPSPDGAVVSVFAAALLLAFVVDFVLGEPPAAWHPVVWMGRYLEKTGGLFAPFAGALPGGSVTGVFMYGAFYWCLGAGVVVIAAAILETLLLQGPWWAAVPGMALLLKPLFAWAMLRREVQAVEAALDDSLTDGRERLSWLCSRDVSQLGAGQVRETAIETLAENLNDSVVAPVFWFVLLGLPGAALYRFANTADAMWGYIGVRSGRDWTWAGKWAARVDDVLSWVPARLTAVLLALAAGGVPLRVLCREATRTPSPNSGWPMAAMALTLGVHLGKPGVYQLNADGKDAQLAHTERALRLAARAVWLLLISGFLIIQFGRSWA